MFENKNDANRNLEKALQALEQAKEMPMFVRQELHNAQYAKIKSTAVSREKCQQVGMEVIEMIAKVRERKGRLDLPIVSGKHLRKISDRTALQSADNAEKFITTRKIDSSPGLVKFTADREQRYQQLETVHFFKGAETKPLKGTVRNVCPLCADPSHL